MLYFEVGMKQLNLSVEDEVYAAAKEGAEAKGQLLRRWISDAILQHSRSALAKREREYAPIEDQS